MELAEITAAPRSQMEGLARPRRRESRDPPPRLASMTYCDNVDVAETGAASSASALRRVTICGLTSVKPPSTVKMRVSRTPSRPRTRREIQLGLRPEQSERSGLFSVLREGRFARTQRRSTHEETAGRQGNPARPGCARLRSRGYGAHAHDDRNGQRAQDTDAYGYVTRSSAGHLSTTRISTIAVPPSGTMTRSEANPTLKSTSTESTSSKKLSRSPSSTGSTRST